MIADRDLVSAARSAALKSAVFTILVPGTVAGLVPGLIAELGGAAPVAALILGWVLIAVGGAAGLWCIAEFAVRGKGTPAPTDPPRELVTHGLYQLSRNPMYVAVLAVVSGQAAVRWSFNVLIYALLLWLAFDTFARLYEEPALTANFGECYVRYRERVPRWLRFRRRT